MRLASFAALAAIGVRAALDARGPAFGGYWARVTASADCTASAQFTYR